MSFLRCLCRFLVSSRRSLKSTPQPKPSTADGSIGSTPTKGRTPITIGGNWRRGLQGGATRNRNGLVFVNHRHHRRPRRQPESKLDQQQASIHPRFVVKGRCQSTPLRPHTHVAQDGFICQNACWRVEHDVLLSNQQNPRRCQIKGTDC